MIGQWHNDVRQGIGKYIYINGDTYEGEWDTNLRHGTGTYTYKQTGAQVILLTYVINSISIQYVGQWVNGRREGTGELIFPGYKYKGNFLGDQVHILL